MKYWRYLFAFFVLFSFCSVFSEFPNAEAKTSSTASSKSFGYINTDKTIYLQGESVKIFGRVWNISNNSQVTLQALSINQNKQNMIYSVSINPTKYGSFSYISNSTNIGKYNITSSINGTVVSSTAIQVISIYETLHFRFLMISLGFFGSLMVAIGYYIWKYGKMAAYPEHLYRIANQGNAIRYYTFIDMLRFICISGMVIFFIISFSVLTSEIGSAGPIGLVERHVPNIITTGQSPSILDQPRQVWLLTVGGIQTNTPISGLYIPIFIILGGVIGGYIRYLYKAATKDEKIAEETIKSWRAHGMPVKFIHETYEEISQIALSGLLAIIVWFLISSGNGTPNIYTLGGISLTVGLITKEVVSTLSDFAKKLTASYKKDNNP